MFQLVAVVLSSEEDRMVNDYRLLAKQDVKFFKLCGINTVSKLMFTSRCIWDFFNLN